MGSLYLNIFTHMGLYLMHFYLLSFYLNKFYPYGIIPNALLPTQFLPKNYDLVPIWYKHFTHIYVQKFG